MNNNELQWLAGIFEGEGSIKFHVSPQCSTFGQWEAELKMTDADVVRKFHALVGIGNVRGPITKQAPCQDGTPRKPCYVWRIGAQEDVLNFCALFAPHMGARRCQRMMDCVADLTACEWLDANDPERHIARILKDACA